MDTEHAARLQAPAELAGTDETPAPGPIPGAGPQNDQTSKRNDRRDRASGRLLGEFQLTYYWMADERGRRRDTRIYTSDCKPIARVNSAFADRLALEGTGRLRDGRVVNVVDACDCEYSPCFFVVDEQRRWGVGVNDRPLSPFRSVAVDPSTVTIGTQLYIPQLDGLVMPGVPPWGGFVHDGCVVADDRGGNVAGKQLDFYMLQRLYYRAFHRRHRLTEVTVFDGTKRCADKRQDLVPVDRNSI